MSVKKPLGIKSAYELAMARLDQQAGPLAALSAEQKRALAEIDCKAQARIAEIEIFAQKNLRELLAAEPGADAAAKVRQLEEEKVVALARVRREAEADKERVRKGG